MKRILFILISLISFCNAQVVYYGNGVDRMQGYGKYFLNHADSVFKLIGTGVKVYKPFILGIYTTSGRPSAALFAGAMIANSDSSYKIQYSDGSNWLNVSQATGGGSDGNGIYSGSGSLSGNTVVTMGTNTLTFNSNSANKFHIDASGRVCVGSTTNDGYQFQVNGLGGFKDASSNSLFFNGSNLAYTAATINTIRFIDDVFRWDWEQDNGTIRFTPNTSNSAFFKVRNQSGTDYFSIDISGATTTLSTKVKINGALSQTPVNILGRFSDSTVVSTSNIPVSLGGTGIQSYTAGDLLYASGSTTLSKLGIGSNGYVLTSNGSTPQWTDPASIGTISATLTTTSTSAQTVATLSTSSNERGVIEVTMVGLQAAGTSGTTGKKIVEYKNVAGSMTVGTVQNTLPTVSDDGSTWTITTSGTNIIIQVTPGSTTSTTWYARYTYTRIVVSP